MITGMVTTKMASATHTITRATRSAMRSRTMSRVNWTSAPAPDVASASAADVAPRPPMAWTLFAISVW